ncbi:hypothetical protein HYV74_03425 [Candidatus Uhrbacteria bacterium]|nr:hypothetical protein [Candidatus Uhrbacteria bacterium]
MRTALLCISYWISTLLLITISGWCAWKWRRRFRPEALLVIFVSAAMLMTYGFTRCTGATLPPIELIPLTLGAIAGALIYWYLIHPRTSSRSPHSKEQP